jgi:hypothetical protein
VLFLRPNGVPEAWERTGLWRLAERIPGVTPLSDLGGAEAQRFRAETSGQTLPFAPNGRVVFRGGITGARGQTGSNPA